jgi:F-type H+-transporting ATPase subunit gamma
MASFRQVRSRIRSIENTAKVTKAMELVAAAKMRRAQQVVLAGRPYAEKMLQVLSDLAAQPHEEDDELSPMLVARDVNRVEIVHITPDRGLCGGLPGNLNRKIYDFISDGDAPTSVVSVGKKGRNFVVRSGYDLRAEFTGLGDKPSLADTLDISHAIVNDYISGFADRVYILYPQFVSTAVQKPVMRQILPVQPAELSAGQAVGYIYEPDSTSVLKALLPRFVEMEVYQSILETIASEQSARMVAMRNATDNAQEVVEDLTLVLNKVRQESITKELLDIVGGVAALT